MYSKHVMIRLGIGLSLLFVALDDQDLAVKRMHRWVSVQPGERMSCIGCHLQRTQTTLPDRMHRSDGRSWRSELTRFLYEHVPAHHAALPAVSCTL